MQHVHDAVHHFLRETHTPPVGFGRNRTKVYGGLGFDEGGGELGFDEDDLWFAEEQLTPALKRVPWRLWLVIRTDQLLGRRAYTEFTHGSWYYLSVVYLGKSRTVSSIDSSSPLLPPGGRPGIHDVPRRRKGLKEVPGFGMPPSLWWRARKWWIHRSGSFLTQGPGRVRVKLFPLTE